MDQYTKEVVELLQDVEKAAFVPPSQPEKVEAVVSKMTALYKRANDLQEADGYDGSPSAVMGPRVCMLTLARLQRCLLAYLRCRMERIEQVRWDLAGAMDDASKAHLSRHELSYSERFNELLAEFQMAYDLDLTRDYQPPEDLYVRVNVLQDIGQFIGPESGQPLELKRGDHTLLRRGDIEHLIRQGLLEHSR